MKKLWITPCFYDPIFLFQITNSVLSRYRGHSLDRYEVAIHPSGRLQCIQLSSGDHQSVYTSILSTNVHPLKTSHNREVFQHLLKSVYSSKYHGFGFEDKTIPPIHLLLISLSFSYLLSLSIHTHTHHRLLTSLAGSGRIHMA